MDDTLTLKLINHSKSRNGDKITTVSLFPYGTQQDASDEDIKKLSQTGLYSAAVSEELSKKIKGISICRASECQFSECNPSQCDKTAKTQFFIPDSANIKDWVTGKGKERIIDPDFPKELIFTHNSGFIFSAFNADDADENNDGFFTVKVRLVLETTDKNIYQSEELLIDLCTKYSVDEMARMLTIVSKQQPRLLLSAFQRSPQLVFLDRHGDIKDSIEARLKIMKECIIVYEDEFSTIVRKKKFKLKEYECVDDINKLTKLSSKTITYMAMNPQYLREVKRNKGIKYNNNVYLPEKTLITRNRRDYNIYENTYIVGFLNTMISECKRLDALVNSLISVAEDKFYSANIQSKMSDFEGWLANLKGQKAKISKYRSRLDSLYYKYRTGFDIDRSVKPDTKKQRPRATAIFNQLPEYNVFYKKAFTKWFDFGAKIADSLKDADDVYTTAVSDPSTTYELYIVTRWIEYLKNPETGLNYELKSENVYYSGISERKPHYSDCSYEFEFVNRDDENDTITIFYRPRVYVPTAAEFRAKEKETGRSFNVDDILFRRTKKSLGITREDGETHGKGGHYEPDFIIKYQKDKVIRYIMADAKHKDYTSVCETEVSNLHFKYIVSLAPRNVDGYDSRIAGLCAICSEAVVNESGEDKEKAEMEIKQNKNIDFCEYNDIAYKNEEEPFVNIVYMNETDDDYKNTWEDAFGNILEKMKSY